MRSLRGSLRVLVCLQDTLYIVYFSSFNVPCFSGFGKLTMKSHPRTSSMLFTHLSHFLQGSSRS